MHTPPDRAKTRHDDGFTLVEVIVALLILSIILTASIAFVVRAGTLSSYQQHNQVAVTIANQAMERVSATTPNQVALVKGRTKMSVESAWTEQAGRDGVATTYPLWDDSATSSSTPSVALTQAQTLEGTVYKTVTLIGACYRTANYDDDLVNVSCGKITGQSAAPAVTPTGYNKLIRTLVIVMWTADDECPGGCTYQTAAYTDISGDVEWKQ